LPARRGQHWQAHNRSVAQHLGVDGRQSGPPADALDWRLMASTVNGPPRSVTNTKAETGNLTAPERMGAACRSWARPHVQGGCATGLDLRPFEIDDLRGVQAVPIRDQCRAAVTISTLPVA
jgi:hypothetical protein